jgi:hypothetical protein
VSIDVAFASSAICAAWICARERAFQDVAFVLNFFVTLMLMNMSFEGTNPICAEIAVIMVAAEELLW